jgi:hypothetical protein
MQVGQTNNKYISNQSVDEQIQSKVIDKVICSMDNVSTQLTTCISS